MGRIDVRIVSVQLPERADQPHVVARIGGESHKTGDANTHNATFNHLCNFVNVDPNTNELFLQVWNDGRREMVGSCTVPLDGLFRQTVDDNSHELSNGGGKIRVRIFCHDCGLAQALAGMANMPIGNGSFANGSFATAPGPGNTSFANSSFAPPPPPNTSFANSSFTAASYPAPSQHHHHQHHHYQQYAPPPQRGGYPGPQQQPPQRGGYPGPQQQPPQRGFAYPAPNPQAQHQHHYGSPQQYAPPGNYPPRGGGGGGGAGGGIVPL